jgi:MtrB/PioB family decaheme-associated outer membrane protein
MRTYIATLILSATLWPLSAIAGQQPAAATPPATQPPAAAAAPADAGVSLFEQSWQQFQLGARISSEDGDPARWQRYRDLRDGVVFTNFRYQREWQDTGQRFEAMADNVGYRDGRYIGSLERQGRFSVTGSWDGIPQFYSVDTATPYTRDGGATLTLDDATQQAIQNTQGTPNNYVPLATQFDMIERRDTGLVNVTFNTSTALQLTSSFRTQKHVGELPFGASFGFSNDVEVALPYTSRTNDFAVGGEWTNQRSMLRVGYDGSWFNNNDDTLVWDSPLRLTDSSSAPGRGRMALWPTNQAHTFSVAGSTRLAARTQLTAFLSYGLWSNDSPLLPFTINSQLPVIPLPRETADASANVMATNFAIVSRPADDLRVTARVRTYNFDNQMPQTTITNYVSYDSSVNTSLTNGPFVYSHARGNITADATWTGLPAVALGVGYARNHGGYVHRIYSDTDEDVFTLSADAVSLPWGSVRAQAEFSDRSGSGLDEASLVQIHEQPAMRHYDVANRNRRKFEGQLDLFPNDTWNVSVNAGFGDDDYEESYFGLQESSFRVAGLALDFLLPSGFGAGASYNYETYSGFHVSRSAGSDAEAVDPARDWSTDSSENVHYFSLYLTPPRIGRNTEARLAYDYSDARANFVYGIAPNSPLVPPNQLPENYNTLQELRGEVRHRLSNRLALTFAYAFEDFNVYDFAFDPTVVNGIVQPSSLVLGYVYRPYTTHTAIAGLLYRW